MSYLPRNNLVIAGLDPAIHPFKQTFVSLTDARVKPVHDGLCDLRAS